MATNYITYRPGMEIKIGDVVVGRLEGNVLRAIDAPWPQDLFNSLPPGQVIELHGPEIWFPVVDTRAGMSGQLSTIRIALLGTVEDLPGPVFFCVTSCPWLRTTTGPFCGLFLTGLDSTTKGYVPCLKCSEYTGNVRDRLPEVEVVERKQEEQAVPSIAPCCLDLEDP